MDNDLYTVWPVHNTVIMLRVLFTDDRLLNWWIKLIFGSSLLILQIIKCTKTSWLQGNKTFPIYF